MLFYYTSILSHLKSILEVPHCIDKRAFEAQSTSCFFFFYAHITFVKTQGTCSDSWRILFSTGKVLCFRVTLCSTFSSPHLSAVWRRNANGPPADTDPSPVCLTTRRVTTYTRWQWWLEVQPPALRRIYVQNVTLRWRNAKRFRWLQSTMKAETMVSLKGKFWPCDLSLQTCKALSQLSKTSHA